MAIAANPWSDRDIKPAGLQTQAVAFAIARATPAPRNVVAVTHEGGYMIHADGSRSHFPAPRCTGTRRNQQGRCVYDELTFSDGSKLIFRWSEDKGGYYTHAK